MPSLHTDTRLRVRKRLAALLVYLGTAVVAGVITHTVRVYAPCIFRSCGAPIESVQEQRPGEDTVLTVLAPSREPVAVEDQTPPTEKTSPTGRTPPKRTEPPNLSGRWLVTNVIDTTTHSRFAGLRIGFRVAIEQHGDAITGRGEKHSVDGQPVPRRQRTPILFEGTVRGREAVVRFVEHGARTVSRGAFRWHLSSDGGDLEGTFESTAARSHGRSHARRESP